MVIIEISYNVLYVWHCMELYDKKFFINGNCMIRSFGQPGKLDMAAEVDDYQCPLGYSYFLYQKGGERAKLLSCVEGN